MQSSSSVILSAIVRNSACIKFACCFAEVRADAREGPGPGVANVWAFAPPRKSMSDHQVNNGGTRTFEHPEGVPPLLPSEEEGNEHCTFVCSCVNDLHDNDKAWLVENSAPSGRYPKLWDHPDMIALRARTGAMIIAVAQCAFGKAPADMPLMRTRKLSWWLVCKEL